MFDAVKSAIGQSRGERTQSSNSAEIDWSSLNGWPRLVDDREKVLKRNDVIRDGPTWIEAYEVIGNFEPGATRSLFAARRSSWQRIWIWSEPVVDDVFVTHGEEYHENFLELHEIWKEIHFLANPKLSKLDQDYWKA